ncbi:MAG TPA: F0F1 ATP synthase subunit delta [Methylomirabilota bacterium]|nr:F0F1 ATP synthase subunit delta [Methylomirabilota bacterium]
METLDLSNFIQTKAEANDFISRLGFIADACYQNNFRLDHALMEQFGVQKKEKFLTLLREHNINSESASALKTFFTSLSEKITGLTVLSLTIAFEPTEQTLKAFSDWFVLNLCQQVLFDIRVDRKLIAGAAVTFKGKYVDFSIRPKFEQVLQRVLTTTAPQKQTQPASPPNEHQTLEDMHLGR